MGGGGNDATRPHRIAPIRLSPVHLVLGADGTERGRKAAGTTDRREWRWTARKGTGQRRTRRTDGRVGWELEGKGCLPAHVVVRSQVREAERGLREAEGPGRDGRERRVAAETALWAARQREGAVQRRLDPSAPPPFHPPTNVVEVAPAICSERRRRRGDESGFGVTTLPAVAPPHFPAPYLGRSRCRPRGRRTFTGRRKGVNRAGGNGNRAARPRLPEQGRRMRTQNGNAPPEAASHAQSRTGRAPARARASAAATGTPHPGRRPRTRGRLRCRGTRRGTASPRRRPAGQS